MLLMLLLKLLQLTPEMERMAIEAGDQQLNLLLGRRMGLRHSKSGLRIMLLFVSQDRRDRNQDHSQAMVCLRLLHKPLMVLLHLLHKLDQLTKPQQNK